MSYASTADMIDRFGETELLALTDRNDEGQIDQLILLRALDDADGEIDGYLAGQYTLPLTTTPTVLKRIAADIARYRLQEDRPTDVARQRYDDAIAFLKLLAEGKAKLGVDPTLGAAASSGGPLVDAPGRTFTKDSLKEFGS